MAQIYGEPGREWGDQQVYESLKFLPDRLSKNYLERPPDAIFTTKMGLSASIWGQFWLVLATFSLIF